MGQSPCFPAAKKVTPIIPTKKRAEGSLSESLNLSSSAEDFETKQKKVMAELGVKEKIYVPLDLKEQLSYDPTRELVVKLDSKKEIIESSFSLI